MICSHFYMDIRQKIWPISVDNLIELLYFCAWMPPMMTLLLKIVQSLWIYKNKWHIWLFKSILKNKVHQILINLIEWKLRSKWPSITSCITITNRKTLTSRITLTSFRASTSCRTLTSRRTSTSRFYSLFHSCNSLFSFCSVTLINIGLLIYIFHFCIWILNWFYDMLMF